MALVVSALLHLAWWFLSPRKPDEPDPEPPPESVQVQLIEAPEPPPAPKPPTPRGPTNQKSVTRRRPATPPPAVAPRPQPAPSPAAPPEPIAGGDAAPEFDAEEAPAPPVDLFARGALQRSVQSWSRGRAPAVKRAPKGTGSGSNTLVDEKRRVGNRVDGWLAQAQIDGAGQAGLAGGCDDGIDNNFDGEIDCSDAGCRQLPMCHATGVYLDTRGEDIPDGDGRVLVRELLANQEGRLRKLTVRVRLSHGDPRQVNVSLTAPGGQRVALHSAHESDSGYLTVFYVRELIGVTAGGRWTLEVEDTTPAVRGRLLGWELYVTS